MSINDEFELKIYTLLENFRKEPIKIDAKLSFQKVLKISHSRQII